MAIIFIALAAACSQDEPVANHKEDAPKTEVGPYEITEEEALANLYAFLDESGDGTSRSGNLPVVESIYPVEYTPALSRGNTEILDCTKLLYVANFEKATGGYAIMAADKRIKEDVIAMVERGTLSQGIFNNIMLQDTTRYIDPNYPSTGPALFTVPEYGDELFLNPNTFSPYDDELQDTIVGNYANINQINPEEYNNNNSQQYTASICAEFAVDRVLNFQKMDPNDIYIDGMIHGGSDGHLLEITIEADTSAWTTLNDTPKHLEQFRFWRQDTIFNALYPDVRKYGIVGPSKKAAAGCFPLAIAKILTLYRPESLKWKGFPINWDGLTMSSDIKQIESASAAMLLDAIRTGCHSLCFYEGTFTWQGKATSFLRSKGLNAKRLNYTFSRVKEMIDQSKPLIIYAIPGINITKSHAWNIDGYRIKERTITTKIFRGGVYSTTMTQKETSNMVHCDFGWSGAGSGYYVSGVFNTAADNRELDYPNKEFKNHYYNHHIRVIMY